MDIDPRITTKASYGQHIPLTCKNHQDLRWSTKNIERIGARSIFFTKGSYECSCPASDLIVVEDEIKE